VHVSFYRSISKFITDNSPQTDMATEEWFYGIVDKKSTGTIAQNALLGVPVDQGSILKAALDHLRLSTGKRYRITEDSLYTELVFSGTARLTIQEPESVVTRVAAPGLKGNGRAGAVSLQVYQPVYAASNLAGDLYGGVRVVPGNWEFPEAVMRTYRCTFELEVSARIEGGKLKSMQTDRVELKSLEHVPDLAG